MPSTVEPILCTDHNWLPDSSTCSAQASLTAVFWCRLSIWSCARTRGRWIASSRSFKSCVASCGWRMMFSQWRHHTKVTAPVACMHTYVWWCVSWDDEPLPADCQSRILYRELFWTEHLWLSWRKVQNEWVQEWMRQRLDGSMNGGMDALTNPPLDGWTIKCMPECKTKWKK